MLGGFLSFGGLFIGIIAIIAGIIVLIRPQVIAYIVGIYLIIAGAVAVLAAV